MPAIKLLRMLLAGLPLALLATTSDELAKTELLLSAATVVGNVDTFRRRCLRCIRLQWFGTLLEMQ